MYKSELDSAVIVIQFRSWNLATNHYLKQAITWVKIKEKRKRKLVFKFLSNAVNNCCDEDCTN